MKEVLSLAKALNFAAQKHVDQKRKGENQEPYIVHLTEVAELLAGATDGTDVNLVIAGLLHDTIEDVDVTREELEREFGQDVAELVAEVTDDKSLPKAARKQHQVDSAGKKSDRAKMIKLADKTSNLRSITASPPTDWLEDRKREYFDWAAQVVAGCRGVNARLERAFDAAHETGLARIG